MKANLRNSFAKRSLVIAAAALPSLYAGLANAQAAAPAPTPPAVPAAPAAPAGSLPAPIAGDASPTAGAAVAPAVVVPQAPAAPTPEVAPMPAAPPPAPVDPDMEKYKHISMGVWSRIGFGFQKADNPKKIDGVGTGGEVELHFSNQMRKSIAWTANFAASIGAPDGGSYMNAPGGGAISGSLVVQDLIAQFEPDPAFNLWVGRMLVASDRSNFSGPYFMAPWIYPLFLGPQGAPFAVVGPLEGPYGRSNGATIWGQAQGGTFKYYLGAYDLYDAIQKPLISGRVSVSLLNPEPGYYGSSTYYGMDLLGLGLGFQYSKNKHTAIKGDNIGNPTDYGMILADLLFEKNLQAAGVLDVEGAFYKYIGDGEGLNWSYMGLLSYLTPEVSPGAGKLQPLVRVQQAKEVAEAGDNTVTMIDGQVGYVIDSYSTRLAAGFAHSSAGNGADYSNAAFLGVQLQK